MCKLCKGVGTYRGITGISNYCTCNSGCEAEINFLEAELIQSTAFNSLCRPKQIAQLVRLNAERWAIRNGYKRSLQHLCGLCTAALAVALRSEGFRPTVVEGEVHFWGHAWLVYKSEIIDTTYTQFDGSAPRVFVTEKKDKRFRALHNFNGKRLDRWLIDPRLPKKDVETLAMLQVSSTGSGDSNDSQSRPASNP